MNQLNILFYETGLEKLTIEVFYEDETFWLSQKKMAELFGKDVRTINDHLKNIFDSGELDKEATIRDFRIVQKEEIDELNRIVGMYLDYAENQAKRQIPMKMADWIDKLDAFLQFNDYKVLKDAGKIRMSVAQKLAESQWEEFRVKQDQNFESDFDKVINQLPKTKKE